MKISPFCQGCGQKVEWHDNVEGRLMAIDPDPHPDGTLGFNERMRLKEMPVGSKPRMYRAHFDTCTKKGEAPRRAGFACDWRGGCARTDPHRHCYGCGGTDHFIAECPEAA